MSIVIAIIMLAVLILAHELGHFMVARWIGIPVHEFSLGFGTKLLSAQKGGTEYSLRLIPLGGYVRMAGEEPGDMNEPAGFNNRKPWEKMAVSFAGAFMNLVLAVLIFIYIFAVIGVAQPMDDALVGEIVSGKPAASAGLQTNDRILTVNGMDIASWEQFVDTIKTNQVGAPMDIEIERDGAISHLTIKSVLDETSGNPIIGVYPQIQYARQGILEAIKLGFIQTYDMTVLLLGGLGMLVSGQASSGDLAGPVGIYTMVGEAAQGGMIYLLSFTAFLSINLGIINLLPIPALDGSRIVFGMIEAVRRKPMDPEKEGFIHWLGFLFLMLLIVFVTYNDIVRLIKG